MGTRYSAAARCLDSRRILTSIGILTVSILLLGLSPHPAAAQSGVDNSTATGVFQTEGDAQRTGTICWLPFANGGPAIATPGSTSGGNPNKLDVNGCPTVNPAGASATWSLVSYGSGTDDWSSFGFANGAFTTKAHALFTPTIVSDAVSSQTDNTFLGASSKDTQDISAWGWNPHGVQDKDDIEHAFAAASRLANGHTAIYAGMDRLANAGDSTAGFWFVQDSNFALCTGFHLSANPSGPGNVANNNCTASGTFAGHHFDGDLLIVSDFSVGGAVSTINVFVWQGGNLVLDATRSPAPCDPVNAGNTLCGLVNNAFTQGLNRKNAPVLSPATVAPGGWTFGDKGGFSAYQTGEFLEIAIDLNDPNLFPSGAPCFSTFFAETRSSTSSTASLSDLTVPTSFPLCSLSASKTCTSASIVNGNQVQYNFSGSVSNTGSNTLYSPVVYDTPPSSIVGNLSLTQPVGPISAGSSATYSGSFVSSTILGSSDKNRISAAASSNSGGTPLNVVCGTNPPTGDADECADWGAPSCSPTITTGLTITKACKSCLVASGGDVHVTVSEAFKVCNTGNTNVSNLTVKDCRGTISGSPGSQICSTGFNTILSNGSLAAGTCTAQLSSSYTPTTLPTGTEPGYSDQVIASGTAALSGTVYANNGVPVSATCPVCPINTDCSTTPPVAP